MQRADTIHLTMPAFTFCKESLDTMMSGLTSVPGLVVKKEYQFDPTVQ